MATIALLGQLASQSLSILLLIFTIQLGAQSFDFEDGLEGWTPDGLAFSGQPVRHDRALTDGIAHIKLGGDYWRQLSYPLGQHRSFLIMSATPLGDGPTGTLASPTFNLSPRNRHFNFLIGGTNDIAHERLELQVHASAAEMDQLEHQIAEWASRAAPSPLPIGASRRDQDYLVVVSATGASEQLRQETFELPSFLESREMRVKLIDDSPVGHVNADYIRFTSAAPEPWRTPVWGYADYHTHPANHLAFGALKLKEGIHTIWGDPGGNYNDYQATPSLVNNDLPRCKTGHGGGPFANPFLNAAQKLQYGESLSLLIPHGKNGAPKFEDWPAFTAGDHQQMHITQIRRNYEGGLRLLVGLATDNWGAEYLMSHVHHGHVQLVDELVSVEAQLKRMIKLADDNQRWMQIAHSPEEARSIILQNKLALILGVEVDQLGTYHFPSIQYEIDHLWNLGVRVVTPIHAADNKLGGAAVFIGPYNWLNDLLFRGRHDLSKKDLNRFPPAFFQINEDKCGGAAGDRVGECVELRLEWANQSRVYIGRCFASLGRLSPCLAPTKYPEYNTAYGQKNRQGLTQFGNDYILALMDHGMILDTAHMSDASVKDTFDLIGRRLERDHPNCRGFSYWTDVSDDCNQLAYPAIVSHAHFRAQALYGNDSFPPSEYDISNRNIEMVRRVGGVLGPFVAEDRIPLPSAHDDVPSFVHDCAMSSKSFGYSFHFALQRMRGTGVGMATDFTFIPAVAPRFGDGACWAYHLARNPSLERTTHQKDRYAVDDQRNGVFYKDMAVKTGVSAGTNVALDYYQLGDYRKYDFNVDGLAHFGLVPDMLQDLKNLGLSRTDFESLFSSAEGYLQMWEKTERISRYHDPKRSNISSR